jgi:hypothetical protein
MISSCSSIVTQLSFACKPLAACRAHPAACSVDGIERYRQNYPLFNIASRSDTGPHQTVAQIGGSTSYTPGVFMHQLTLALLAAGLLSASSVHAQADLIITNGKIATMDRDGEFVEALAIKDGKIAATGTNATVLALRQKDTKVIDVAGRTVIPGLNDSHTHVIRAGLNYNMELRWDGVRTLKRAMEMLREQAARTPDGEWVKVVGGWTEHQFEEKRLRRWPRSTRPCRTSRSSSCTCTAWAS